MPAPAVVLPNNAGVKDNDFAPIIFHNVHAAKVVIGSVIPVPSVMTFFANGWVG